MQNNDNANFNNNKIEICNITTHDDMELYWEYNYAMCPTVLFTTDCCKYFAK